MLFVTVRRGGLTPAWIVGCLGISAGFHPAAWAAEESKIRLTPAMVRNECGYGDATLLVDEQETAADPASGKGGTPKTLWIPGWKGWEYPASAVIDLGAKHRLTNICYYHGTGKGELTIAAGTPFQWQPVVEAKLAGINQWVPNPCTVETRYLQVRFAGPGTNVQEIVLYGKALEAPAKTPEPVTHPLPLMDQFIGTNAFIDDPIDSIAVGGFVREYHNWDWNDSEKDPNYKGFPDNQLKFNPSSNGYWNFDKYYQKLVQRGVMVCPDLKQTAKWVPGEGVKFNREMRPVAPGKSSTDPAAYIAHGDYVFQFAARYGSTKVDDKLLKLAPGQPRESGMKLISYLENWNEQDKTWHGPESHFNAYEFAAMSSADYDGHRSALGRTVGLKNADPNMKLVMGGLAGLKLEFIQGMKFWADYHRNGSLPFDVLNVHHYCNTGGDQLAGKSGISPEADHFKERLQELVDYRNRYMPGKELWITEFGYDTHQKSTQRAPEFAGKNAEQVQAEWLIRSYLAIAAAGVDKAAMYMLRDVDPANTTKYSTSGLVGPKGSWQPKLSWYYVYTMKNRLAGMRFAGEKKSEHKNVWVYGFQQAKGPSGAYAVWCPTADGTQVPGYSLAVGRATSATLVRMVSGRTDGEATPLVIHNGHVTFDAAEQPVFVLVDAMN